MKKGLILVSLIIIIFTSYTAAFAQGTTGTAGITLDGDFSDWAGKPYIDDPKHDKVKPWDDFLGARYITDDSYLYLDVQRLAAKKSDIWDFSVVIANGVKGTMLPQYTKEDGSTVYAPQFDIKSHYSGNKSTDGIIVDVYFNGEKIESNLYAASDNKEVEFRIPLSYVGLDGLNKEVRFMLKSDPDKSSGNVDWFPAAGTVTVATGPTFYILSTIVFFAAVSLMAYRIYKKKRIAASAVD